MPCRGWLRKMRIQTDAIDVHASNRYSEPVNCIYNQIYILRWGSGYFNVGTFHQKTLYNYWMHWVKIQLPDLGSGYTPDRYWIKFVWKPLCLSVTKSWIQNSLMFVTHLTWTYTPPQLSLNFPQRSLHGMHCSVRLKTIHDFYWLSLVKSSFAETFGCLLKPIFEFWSNGLTCSLRSKGKVYARHKWGIEHISCAQPIVVSVPRTPLYFFLALFL